MIDHEMDFRRVPDFGDAHFCEDLDGEGPGTILSHREVDRQYGDVSWAMDLVRVSGSDADYFLGESQRIVVQDVLTQRRSERGEKNQSLLNVNVESG